VLSASCLDASCIGFNYLIFPRVSRPPCRLWLAGYCDRGGARAREIAPNSTNPSTKAGLTGWAANVCPMDAPCPTIRFSKHIDEGENPLQTREKLAWMFWKSTRALARQCPSRSCSLVYRVLTRCSTQCNVQARKKSSAPNMHPAIPDQQRTSSDVPRDQQPGARVAILRMLLDAPREPVNYRVAFHSKGVALILIILPRAQLRFR
jgi:hypothetical protein